MASIGVFISKTSRFISQNVRNEVTGLLFRFRNCHRLLSSCSTTSTLSTNCQPTEQVQEHRDFVVTPELQCRLNEEPYVRFDGEIHLVSKADHELSSEPVRRVLQEFAAADALGFDAEFSVERGMKVCLVQLASQTVSILWRVNNLGSRKDLPQGLIELLSANVFKVGHGSTNDAILLLQHLGINTKNVIDTLPWAVTFNCHPRTLQAMCALFLNCRVSKAMARSNWDRLELSSRQVVYAATDAWLSLKVYMEMKRKAEELDIELDLKASSAEELAEIIAVNQRESRRLKNKRMRQQRSARKQSLKQEQQKEFLENEIENNEKPATTLKDCSVHLKMNEIKEEKQVSLSEISLNKRAVADPQQVSNNDTENLTKLYQSVDTEEEHFSQHSMDSYEQSDTSSSSSEVPSLVSQEHGASQRRETARLRRLRYRKRKKEKEFWYKIGIVE